MAVYVATLFVAPSANAESIGAAMAGWTENIRAEDIQPILKKHGLETIEPEKWYNMQVLLNVVKDIVESRNNVLEDLTAVGIKTVETMPLSPEVNSIESALNFINQAVRLTSRNIPDEFGVLLKVVTPQHFLVTNNSPFPEANVYGYLWGLVNRFKAPDHIFTIHALPKEQGTPTVFSIKWGLPDELEQD